MPRTMTEEEWVTTYDPHCDDGGYLRYGYATEGERRLLEQAHAERRLWTFCYTEVGNPYITQGFGYVNREYYIICVVPYTEGEEIIVESETLYCDSCGEWFSDVSEGEDAVERSPTCHWRCVACEEEAGA